MPDINKRGKLVLICITAVAAFIGGMVIEHFEGRTFIEERVGKTATEAVRTPSSTSVSSEGKININTSDAEALETLDGIGKTLAERIIEYRTEHGDFVQKEGIMLVPGVGEKMYEAIKDKICIEN